MADRATNLLPSSVPTAAAPAETTPELSKKEQKERDRLIKRDQDRRAGLDKLAAGAGSLTIGEIAAAHGISERLIRMAVADGRLPAPDRSIRCQRRKESSATQRDRLSRWSAQLVLSSKFLGY